MIHTCAATRINRNQKGPTAPATTDTYAVVVFITVFRWLGMSLVGDSDGFGVAYSWIVPSGIVAPEKIHRA